MVEQGKMTAEEGQRLTEQVYRQTMVEQLLGYPVEEGSIELPDQPFPPKIPPKKKKK